jgi:hypothetical protein
MSQNGADTLLIVNTGTEAVPVYTVIGSQRDVTFTETTETIDGSNKQDGRARRVQAGRYTSTVDMDALFVPNDAAHGLLKVAMRLGLPIKCRRRFAGVDIEQADVIVANIADTHPDQDSATIAVTLEVDGPWSAV